MRLYAVVIATQHAAHCKVTQQLPQTVRHLLKIMPSKAQTIQFIGCKQLALASSRSWYPAWLKQAVERHTLL